MSISSSLSAAGGGRRRVGRGWTSRLTTMTTTRRRWRARGGRRGGRRPRSRRHAGEEEGGQGRSPDGRSREAQEGSSISPPLCIDVVVVDVDVIVDSHCLHTASLATRARHRLTNVAAWEDDAPPSCRELRDGNDGRMTHDADGGGGERASMAVVAGGMGDDERSAAVVGGGGGGRHRLLQQNFFKHVTEQHDKKNKKRRSSRHVESDSTWRDDRQILISSMLASVERPKICEHGGPQIS